MIRRMLPLFFLCALVVPVASETAEDTCFGMYQKPSYSFVEPLELKEYAANETTGCQHVLECSVMQVRGSTTNRWFRNGELQRTVNTHDHTVLITLLRDVESKNIVVFKHRHCAIGPRDEMFGVFKFITVGAGVPHIESPLATYENKEYTQETITRGFLAPFIYMITDSLVEVTGSVVKIFCLVDGHPKPKISWVGYTNDDAGTFSIDKMAAIKVHPDGSLVIDTRLLPGSTATFQCTAENEYGKDSANSTLLIVDP